MVYLAWFLAINVIPSSGVGQPNISNNGFLFWSILDQVFRLAISNLIESVIWISSCVWWVSPIVALKDITVLPSKNVLYEEGSLRKNASASSTRTKSLPYTGKSSELWWFTWSVNCENSQNVLKSLLSRSIRCLFGNTKCTYSY